MTEAWFQVLAIIFANAAISISMVLWIRTEGNADRRDIQNMMLSFHNDIQKEMKDFHGRLCAIEEKNKGK
jgi:hypothetical protein